MRNLEALRAEADLRLTRRDAELAHATELSRARQQEIERLSGKLQQLESSSWVRLLRGMRLLRGSDRG